MTARHPFGTFTPDAKSRCWRYGRDGCRQYAVNSVRYGSHVYRYCADPAHAPEEKT